VKVKVKVKVFTVLASGLALAVRTAMFSINKL